MGYINFIYTYINTFTAQLEVLVSLFLSSPNETSGGVLRVEDYRYHLGGESDKQWINFEVTGNSKNIGRDKQKISDT